MSSRNLVKTSYRHIASYQGGHKIQSLALEDQELIESSYPTSKPILCYSMSDFSLLHRIKVENFAEASTPKVQS